LEAAENGEYYIRPDFDDDLKVLYEQKEALSQQITDHSDKVPDSLILGVK
jgi:hypothetical protein